MTTTIDIDALATPIDGDSPSGEDPRADVRFDSPYQALKNLREDAMATERAAQKGDDDGGDHASARGKWLDVVSAAEELLRHSSKDLEVCALMIEGLVRTDGIPGVRDGMELALRLVRDMWQDLHPHLDPDDPDSMEDRLAAFNGLDGGASPGTLARYIPQLPITAGSGEDYFAYQLEQAFNQRGSNDAGAPLGFSVDDIVRAAEGTPLSFYQDLSDALETAESVRAELDQTFTELCGFDAPSMGRTREALEKMLANVRFLAGDRLDAAAAEAEAAEAADEAVGEGETADAAGAGAAPVAARVPAATDAIQDRNDAIARLRKVAGWFRDNEPHSPLSYSLENLVRWAKLPLDQLIEEWIQDDAALARYRLMTGMNAEDSGD